MSRSQLALACFLIGLAVVVFSALPCLRFGLTGDVRGPEGPLADARVRWQTAAFSTRSDLCGRFQLPARPGGGKITAAKEGYFIGSSRANPFPLTIALTPLPALDNPDYPWVSPDPNPEQPHNCGNCHREIYQEWKQSGHSRSITGKHFRNLYEGTDFRARPGVGWGLLTQYDLGAGVCFSCHAPALPDHAPATLDWDRPPSPTALHGVHCDYCHKIAGAGTDQLGLNHGRFNLRLLRPAADPSGEVPRQLFFGPLDDVDRGEDSWSPLYRSSLYCASCHEGVVFGVHVYSTWSEFLDSPARQQGQQCQDCHLKPTGRMTNVAPGRGGLTRSARSLGNHRFFADSQTAMLRRCLKLSVRWGRVGPDRQATVSLEAREVGHRVPTGFPDRQILLVVEGLDREGQAVPPRDGPTLPALAGADLAGRPGRLYAKVLQDFQGKAPAPFWRAQPELADNRLRPGQPDRLTFTFPEQITHLRAHLLYRRFWQEQIDAKGWPDQDATILRTDYAVP